VVQTMDTPREWTCIDIEWPGKKRSTQMNLQPLLEWEGSEPSLQRAMGITSANSSMVSMANSSMANSSMASLSKSSVGPSDASSNASSMSSLTKGLTSIPDCRTVTSLSKGTLSKAGDERLMEGAVGCWAHEHHKLLERQCLEQIRQPKFQIQGVPSKEELLAKQVEHLSNMLYCTQAEKDAIAASFSQKEGDLIQQLKRAKDTNVREALQYECQLQEANAKVQDLEVRCSQLFLASAMAPKTPSCPGSPRSGTVTPSNLFTALATAGKQQPGTPSSISSMSHNGSSCSTPKREDKGLEARRRRQERRQKGTTLMNQKLESLTFKHDVIQSELDRMILGDHVSLTPPKLDSIPRLGPKTLTPSATHN